MNSLSLKYSKYGCYFLNTDEFSADNSRTILVSGMSRGGTSLIASIIHDLGIPMGRDYGNFEDPALGSAYDSGDWQLLTRIIAERDSFQKSWGWKRPSFRHDLTRVAALVHNPHVIIIYKDPLSIAERKLELGYSFQSSLGSITKSYAEMTQSALSLKSPLMLVSYEASQITSSKLVETIAEFVGISDKRIIQNAISNQENNHSQYLTAFNKLKSKE